MSNITIKEKIDNLQKELDNLKSRYGKNVRRRVEKGEGGRYFLIYANGDEGSTDDNRMTIDRKHYQIGNYYFRKEVRDAEIALRLHIYELIDKYGYIDDGGYCFATFTDGELRKNGWCRGLEYSDFAQNIRILEKAGIYMHIEATDKERGERLELLKKANPL